MTLPDLRSTAFDTNLLNKHACELCMDFQLTLRQVEELFRVLGHACSTKELSQKLQAPWSLGLLLLCALKVKDAALYQSVGSKNLSSKDFILYLLTTMADRHAEFWGTLYHTGRQTDKGQHGSFGQVWSFVGNQKTPTFRGPSELENYFLRDWGDTGYDCILRIYERIETAVTA
jgi:hypothetical protein